MHARVTRLEASADLLEPVTSQFEQETLPELEGQDGFKGYILLADRGSGVAMAITYWESEGAMTASEDVGNQGRERAAEKGGASAAPVVERYEVLSSS